MRTHPSRRLTSVAIASVAAAIVARRMHDEHRRVGGLQPARLVHHSPDDADTASDTTDAARERRRPASDLHSEGRHRRSSTCCSCRKAASRARPARCCSPSRRAARTSISPNSLVDEKYHDEAIARDYVVVSPAAPSTGLFYDDDIGRARARAARRDRSGSTRPRAASSTSSASATAGSRRSRPRWRMPDRFRSLVVFPGYSPDGGDDPELATLTGMGVSMFVGGDDSGWLDASQQTEATLKAAGITVELHVIAGPGPHPGRRAARHRPVRRPRTGPQLTRRPGEREMTRDLHPG